MDLKEMLGEELLTKLTAVQDESVKSAISKLAEKKVIVDDGKLIPKAVFDEEREKGKALKGQIDQFKADFESLKAKNAGNEGLSQQITELQKAQKEAQAKFDADRLSDKKAFAVKEALLNEGVADERARNLLAREFDLAKVDLDDNGKVKGFSEAIKPIKESNAFKSLFTTVGMKGTEHNKGSESEGELFTKEQVKAHDGDKTWMTANFEKVQKSIASWSK
jgi:hypothetical protein